jgi:threonine synthase
VAIGDYLIIDAVHESGGTAIAVTDERILEGTMAISATEGMHMSPEVGACVAAAEELRASNFLKEDERVIIFGTGSGLMHVDLVEGEYPVLQPGDAGIASTIDTWYAS